MQIRHHPHLGHIRQPHIPGMLLKAFVLPEERTRHGCRNHQHIEQCPPHQQGRQASHQHQREQRSSCHRTCRQHHHGQRQQYTRGNQPITQGVGFTKGGALHIMRGGTFAGFHIQVFGVGHQADALSAEADQGHGAEHGHQAGNVSAIDQRQRQQESPQQQAAQAAHGSKEGGDHLPVVPERARLDAITLVHVPQAHQPGEGSKATGQQGQYIHEAPLQPDIHQLEEGKGAQSGQEQCNTQALAGYR